MKWILAPLLLWGLRAPVEACTCGKLLNPVRPGPDEVAPLDTHVWIIDNDGGPPLEPAAPAEPLRLRAVGGADVPTTVRLMVWEEASLTEVVPTKLLAPDKDYEVVRPKGRLSAVDRVIGRFKTGTAVDHTPPSFAGVTRTTFVEPPSKPQILMIKGIKVIRINPASCSRAGASYAVLDVATASDQGTPAEALGYGVWPAGATDLTVPPLLVLLPEGPLIESRPGTPTTRLQLGTDSTCEARAYDFAPALAKVPRPVRKKATKPYLLHFTMAAIDLAGNRSAPADVAIDLAHPVQAPPP